MKTAFVTGASRGIGKAFVEYLLDQGLLVFAGAQNPSGFDKELRANPNLRVVEINVSDDKSIKRAAEVVAKETDHLDYLINNAGINKDTATDWHKEKVSELTKLERELLQKMFDVNAIGPIMVIQEFLSLLGGDASFVINISSNRASLQKGGGSSYANYGYRASKVALNMLTLCSLVDLPENVKTFAVHPGNVKTDMNPNGEDIPYEQAKKMIDITENWKDELNGKFLRYDGSICPL